MQADFGFFRTELGAELATSIPVDLIADVTTFLSDPDNWTFWSPMERETLRPVDLLEH